MAEFMPVIALSSLNGTNGFKITGEAAQDRSGFSVSSAGDVNGDGIDDIIVGAPTASPNASASGASYVVFGTRDGFERMLALSSLDGSNGFKITGEGRADTSGWSVSSAGDVNDDGIDDVVVGASRLGGSGPFGNASYVVFGKNDGFDSTLALSSLDGTNGFKITGPADDGERFGVSASSAGDVNGDGIDDIIVGAPLADPTGFSSGASYVVFGRDGDFDATLAASTLDGSNGFEITGEAEGDQTGRSVSAAGDINGDGIDDLIVGAPYADPNGDNTGASYVVFGRDGGFGRTLALSSLNGSNGFRITGEAAGDYSGVSVSSAGDVNGDGFADIIVGANRADLSGFSTGASYVVFGARDGFDATLAVSSLDGSNGFKIAGEAQYDYSGYSVSSAGDVNGDGFADLIVGAYGAPNGRFAGASYVVFGKAGGFDATLALSSLDGTNGFKISGEAERDYSGRAVSSAGDVNGDGFDDIVVGAYRAGPNGDGSGASYVIFGRGPDAAVIRTGTAADNTISGGALNDRLIGLDGDDTLNGNAGNDQFIGGAGADTLIGGDGSDTAVYLDSGSAVQVDLSKTTAQRGGDAAGDSLSDIENVFGSAGADTLTGNGSANTLVGGAGIDTLAGGAGDDRLDGGTGADTMTGGTGNDLYYVDNTGDTIFEASSRANGTADKVLTTIDFTLAAGLGIEIVQALVDTDLSLTGNELAQTIYGGAGADTLDGGGGRDVLRGLSGDDTYLVGNSGVTIVELAGEGTDTVRSSVSFKLSANLETLTLTGTGAIDGTGDDGANTINGNAAANRLDGGAGADRLIGGAGSDAYVVDEQGDTITEAAGQGDSDAVLASASYRLADGISIETLRTLRTADNAEIDLTGNAGIQTLIGNNGANVLDGRGGADVLRGYGGADSFVFSTTLGTDNVDGIVDFKPGEDRLLLDADIFTGLDVGSLPESAFKVTSTPGAVIEADDRILYDKVTGALSYDADGSGTAAQAVQFATLLNRAALTFQDIEVV